MPLSLPNEVLLQVSVSSPEPWCGRNTDHTGLTALRGLHASLWVRLPLQVTPCATGHSMSNYEPLPQGSLMLQLKKQRAAERNHENQTGRKGAGLCVPQSRWPSLQEGKWLIKQFLRVLLRGRWGCNPGIPLGSDAVLLQLPNSWPPRNTPRFTKGPSLALAVLPLTGTQDYDNMWPRHHVTHCYTVQSVLQPSCHLPMLAGCSALTSLHLHFSCWGPALLQTLTLFFLIHVVQLPLYHQGKILEKSFTHNLTYFLLFCLNPSCHLCFSHLIPPRASTPAILQRRILRAEVKFLVKEFPKEKPHGDIQSQVLVSRNERYCVERVT